MAATTNFVAAQKANRRNTLILLVLTALAALFGYLIGWVLESEATDAVPPGQHGGPGGGRRDGRRQRRLERDLARLRRRLVVAMANAKEIDKDDAPQLFNVVEEMSIAAGVPMPKVHGAGDRRTQRLRHRQHDVATARSP